MAPSDPHRNYKMH